jgi:hypothetical protein
VMGALAANRCLPAAVQKGMADMPLQVRPLRPPPHPPARLLCP